MNIYSYGLFHCFFLGLISQPSSVWKNRDPGLFQSHILTYNIKPFSCWLRCNKLLYNKLTFVLKGFVVSFQAINIQKFGGSNCYFMITAVIAALLCIFFIG
jgi:hypothetical protein